MRYPALRPLKRYRRELDRFYGLEHRQTVREGAFYDAENLASGSFPLLRVRAPRPALTLSRNGEPLPFQTDSPITAAAEHEGALCYCTETGVYLNGTAVENCTFDMAAENRTILPFGRDLFIAPDGKFITRDDAGTPRTRHAAFCRSNVAADVRCGFGPDTAGTLLYHTAADNAPASPYEGMLWLRTAGAAPARLRWDGEAWTEETPVYLVVSATGIGKETAAGDTVYLSGIGYPETAYTAAYRTEDKLYLSGIYRPLSTDSFAVTLRKTMPLLDLAAEHGNRIWGCRYGPDMHGAFVNEIYASVQGDPTVWDRFEGTSADSFRVGLGCPGPFTGVAVVDGALLFFKENYIIRVRGGDPGDFSVSVLPARGVEQGAAKSCVNLNERVYYKSQTGVMRYDGALPEDVSPALADYRLGDAFAAGCGGKYYLSAAAEDAGRALFVLDADAGLWQKEDDPGVRFFVTLRGRLWLLCADAQDDRVYRLLPADPAFIDAPADPFGRNDPAVAAAFEPSAPVSWFAETGDLAVKNGTAVIRGLTFRLQLAPEAEFRAAVLCNGETRWRPVCRVSGRAPGAFFAPVNTPRCHTYRLRFSGTGGCTLCGVRVTAEKTGEVKHDGT